MKINEILNEGRFVILRPKTEGARNMLSRSGKRWELLDVSNEPNPHSPGKEGPWLKLQNRKAGTIMVNARDDEHFSVFNKSTDFDAAQF
jgi:hypothetical protein